MTHRLRTWREWIATPLNAGPLNDYPAVLWPSHRHDLVMDVDMVLFLVRNMTGTLEDELFEEPTQEPIDEWLMIDPDGEE